MAQRSSQEEESLISQRMEYEKILDEQKQLYQEKVTELDRLHSQRKVFGAGYNPSL